MLILPCLPTKSLLVALFVVETIMHTIASTMHLSLLQFFFLNGWAYRDDVQAFVHASLPRAVAGLWQLGAREKRTELAQVPSYLLYCLLFSYSDLCSLTVLTLCMPYCWYLIVLKKIQSAFFFFLFDILCNQMMFALQNLGGKLELIN